MNKFAILALFACVATAFAAPAEINDQPSELALFEDDITETAALKGDKLIFKDFCLSTRDFVKSKLENGINQGAGRLFFLVVQAFEEVNSAVTDSERKAVEESSEDISKDAWAIKDALKKIVFAMKEEGRNKVIEIFRRLREQANLDNLQETAEDSCAYVSHDLKSSLDKRLKEARRQLEAGDTDKTYKSVLESAKIENLGCVTTSRISKVASACRMVSLLGPAVADFFKSKN